MAVMGRGLCWPWGVSLPYIVTSIFGGLQVQVVCKGLLILPGSVDAVTELGADLRLEGLSRRFPCIWLPSRSGTLGLCGPTQARVV